MYATRTALHRRLRLVLSLALLLAMVAAIQPADAKPPTHAKGGSDDSTSDSGGGAKSDSPGQLKKKESSSTDGTTTDGTTTDSTTTDSTTTTPRGLFHTGEEVAVWATRAVNGPYRVAGDAGTNTPGDWTRIQANADGLLNSPSASIWSGPTQGDLSTCVQQWDDAPPEAGADRIRDAGFVGLVTGQTTYTEAARDALLTQMRTAGTDFTNTARWCPGVIGDVNPGFQVAQWVAKLQLAYDFVGDAALTDAERTELDRWFLAAADLFIYDLERGLAGNFVDRQGGDYTLSRARLDNPSCDNDNYVGGPQICSLHRHYNNRRSSMALTVAMVGAHQDSAAVMRQAKIFAQEWVYFGVFPDGSFSEFHRSRDDLPDLGWAYSANGLADVVAIADVLARNGDTSLYDLVTSFGAQGSEGGPKSLLQAARDAQAYTTGDFVRDAVVTSTAPRIDAFHDWWGHGVHDIGILPGLRYWNDAAVASVATRTATGFPDKIASNGPRAPWTGNGGVFPGLLFMFGGMEGVVSPYAAG